MSYLVVNADDFGYSKAINAGIIESFLCGVLTSTTLMANMFGFEEAVKLSSQFPGLGVGVHLSLTCGKPILSKMDSLMEEDGSFISLKKLKNNPESIDLDQLYEEWRAQIQKIKNAQVDITHLDSHHYTHSIGNNYQVIEQLSNDFDIPIRNCFEVKSKLVDPSIAPVDAFWNLFNYPEMKKMDSLYSNIKNKLFDIIEQDAQKYTSFNKIEAVCHPGYLDEEIYFGSSFNLARMREINLLCDDKLKKLLSEYNYVLCTYRDI